MEKKKKRNRLEQLVHSSLSCTSWTWPSSTWVLSHRADTYRAVQTAVFIRVAQTIHINLRDTILCKDSLSYPFIQTNEPKQSKMSSGKQHRCASWSPKKPSEGYVPQAAPSQLRRGTCSNLGSEAKGHRQDFHLQQPSLSPHLQCTMTCQRSALHLPPSPVLRLSFLPQCDFLSTTHPNHYLREKNKKFKYTEGFYKHFSLVSTL